MRDRREPPERVPGLPRVEIALRQRQLAVVRAGPGRTAHQGGDLARLLIVAHPQIGVDQAHQGPVRDQSDLGRSAQILRGHRPRPREVEIFSKNVAPQAHAAGPDADPREG